MKKTMTKHIMSASVLALAVLSVSCAKNDITSGADNDNIKTGQISFRSSTGKSRANDNGLTNVEGGFYVIGTKANNSYISGFVDPAGDNVTYKKTGADWGWAENADQKLWPIVQAEYPLVFFAAYPAETAITAAVTSKAIEVVSNITPNANGVYNTYYEKVANAVVATSISTDLLSAKSTVAYKPITGFTDLSFKHITSNVAFEIMVPAGMKAYIHSIKIANLNYKGRTYDYKTQMWSAETAYTSAQNAHFAHFIASVAQPTQEITSAAATLNGLTDGAGKFNTLKVMPQTSVAAWSLGADASTPDSFKKDAKAWSTANPTVNQAAIDAWHMNTTATAGMKDSKGWEGARIEVIYCLVDDVNKKNIIGRKDGVDGATADQLVRVGYALDLSTLDSKGDASLMGFVAGYRYKFQIPLGRADATNGTLLDPDYKDKDGASTTDPVDNPKTTPGDPIFKAGVINFNVDVKDWESYEGTIK